MTEIKSIGSLSNSGAIQGNRASKEGGASFETFVKETLAKVNTVQNEAEKAIQELSIGGDVSSAVIAMEKADLSFQVMIEVRNKLISAYEEVMRLQV
jgi:flagellar hook-basal body complex protein FliE